MKRWCVKGEVGWLGGSVDSLRYMTAKTGTPRCYLFCKADAVMADRIGRQGRMAVSVHGSPEIPRATAHLGEVEVVVETRNLDDIRVVESHQQVVHEGLWVMSPQDRTLKYRLRA